MQYLITGGAGFIGINFSQRLLSQGHQVTIIDNFSKPGSETNVAWLKRQPNQARLSVRKLNLWSPSPTLNRLVAQSEIIYHLAAQTAVTTSIENPRDDFRSNVLGTFNLLETVRQHQSQAILIYSSTNKVYGALSHLPLTQTKTRYQLQNSQGINEQTPLDFYTPYGCSKGAADQYVLDYARIYGLKTVVFRQSCIYGPHQFGTEDQGWVAWLTLAALHNRPITLFGTGKQVRDLLYIDDLFEAWQRAAVHIASSNGQAYNLGGGTENAISLLEFISVLERKLNHTINIKFDHWRSGDQKVFISDNSKAKVDFGWSPHTPIETGLESLIEWLKANNDKGNFKRLL